MSKYYTPEIEEFHVGFMFEEYTTFDEGTYRKRKIVGWRDRYFNNLTHDIRNKRVRVKYLDRKDIEELGWEYVGGKLIHGVLDNFHLGEYHLRYQYNNHHIIISDKDIKFASFDGTCKNYNELKRIMKQIGL